MRTILKRILCGALGLAAIAALVSIGAVLLDVRDFEWTPLLQLAGVGGVSFLAFLTAGLALLSVAMWRVASIAQRPRLPSATVWIILVIWGIGVAWLAEWTFLEEPLTVRLANALISEDDELAAVATAIGRSRADGSLTAFKRRFPQADEERLALMFARIAINRPSVFDRVSIGAVIDEHATRYGVSPILLLHWAYLDSFYGEAPAGPTPFFSEINGEMLRDLVQAHLPSWFVESPLRRALIEGPFFDRIAGRSIAVKLRYALQKATYDIAISPYMNSVLSDLLLVLTEYKAEFPELADAAASTDPLARSFSALEGVSPMKPYDAPYSHPERDIEYYTRYRDHLKTFSRAAVYRLSSDFEFATKVQALVARYYADEYAKRIGPERWALLSERQRTALLAMLRDVYTPNIGRVSYDLYMVPEFNCTPIAYMATEVADAFDAVQQPNRIWIPPHPDRLWGATGLMLRVLGETWDVVTGAPLSGVPSAHTTRDAVKVLARNHR
ncbi:MAG: hypothetical protein ACT4O5_08555 [Gammaproteobacteria bacterium]